MAYQCAPGYEFSHNYAKGWPFDKVVTVSLYQRLVYRAKPTAARYCQGRLSVCLSVRPSKTLRYRDHIRCNSAKIISRLISPAFYSQTPHNGSTLNGIPPNLAGIGVGYGKLSILDI